MVLEAAPWLMAGFVLAGAVYVLLPRDKVVSQLGRPGLAGVLKATLVGIPLPLCSCSVVPVASSIRKQGASRGATASFLISMPETGLDSIAISYALLGPVLAVARPLAAFFTSVVAGLLIDVQDKDFPVDRHGDTLEDATDCTTCSCEEGRAEPSTVAMKVITAIRYGLGDLFEDLSHWLVLGFLLAGLMTALVPARFFEETVGTGIGAMPLMLAAGLPLYVCATSSTPVAAALIAKGLSPGAALVFLLVGPATNIATMVVVSRELGFRSLAIYVVSIAVIAVASGLALDAGLGAISGVAGELQSDTHGGITTMSWLAAIALMLLLANGLRHRIKRLSTQGDN